uniref:Lipoprotein n=1 Tax=Thermocrinis ruber TaxID=75906 RepID=A0A7C5X4R8_9AQUI
MKKVWVLAALGLLASCGGGGSGTGGEVKGFYSLSVSLDQSDISSPAVSGSPPDISIPPDTISGKVSLAYSGTSSTPLKGVIKRAQLCIEGRSCYSLSVGGVLTANGNPISFTLSLNDYKFNLPWIAVNPYEDTVLATEEKMVSLPPPGTSLKQEVQYFNTDSTVSLPYVPVVENSLMLIGAGDFSKSYTYGGYTSGRINVYLPKGSDTKNQIKPGSVELTAGTIKCKDDGAGKIVEDVGTSSGACSGSIDYISGLLSFQLTGLSGATDVKIDYVVSGAQRCGDDGNGKLVGDCTGSVDYQTGKVSYRFNDNFVAVPVEVEISWTQKDASGNTITYVLPPPTMAGPYVYQVSGRVVEVYQGTTLLCSNRSASKVCSVSVSNNVVSISFSGGVLPNLSLKYSQDTKVDINPSIDVNTYGRLSSAAVSGYVEVEVKLESGETLRARSPITFRVVPK